MQPTPDSLLAAAELAAARRQAVYEFIEKLPVAVSGADNFTGWAQLDQLRQEDEAAHAAYFAAVAARRQAARAAYVAAACPLTPLDQFNAAAYEAQQRTTAHLQKAA